MGRCLACLLHVLIDLLMIMLMITAVVISEGMAHPLLSSGTQKCQRCHEAISEQWKRSAHRHASLSNPYYAAAARVHFDQRGGEDEGSVLFCARCHDPALIDQSTQRVSHFEIDEQQTDDQDPARAGVGCFLCHSISEEPKGLGNGQYTLEMKPIKLRGQAHRERFVTQALKRSTLCGSCHKVGLLEALTHDRWQRGQDDFDQWSQSGWAGVDPLRPLADQVDVKSCQACHMPRMTSHLPDRAKDRDGLLSAHDFRGANASLAAYLREDDHVEEIAAFVRGSVQIWLHEKLSTQDQSEEDGLTLDLVALNTGAGHRIPAGVNDTNEMWMVVEAWDHLGRQVVQSGVLSELIEPPPHLVQADAPLSPLYARGERPSEAHLFRAQPVDQAGQPLSHREVSKQYSVLYDSSLHPFEPRVIRYTFPHNTMRVRIKMMMRQFEARYARFACASLAPDDQIRCETQPVIEMAKVEWSRSKERVESVQWITDPLNLSRDQTLFRGWHPQLIYALALSKGGSIDLITAEEVWRQLPRQVRLSSRGIITKMAIASALGQTDQVVELARSLSSPPYQLSREDQPSRHWIEAITLLKAFRTKEALEPLITLQKLAPQQKAVERLLAASWGALGEVERSQNAAERLLTLDQESAEGWRLLMLAKRAQSSRLNGTDRDRADKEVREAEQAWLRFRVDQERQDQLRRKWLIDQSGSEGTPPLLHALPHYDLRDAQSVF